MSLGSMNRGDDDDAAVEMSRDLGILVNEADRGAGPSAVDIIGSLGGVSYSWKLGQRKVNV